MYEEFYKMVGDVSFNDGLDFVIGIVGEIRDSLVCVD